MRISKQLALFVTIFAALALSAAPAFAGRAHEFTTAFGTRCIAAGSCTGAELFSPDGVAVNEASGEVYVVDKGEGAVGGRVVRFSAAGLYESEFNGSKTPAKSFDRPDEIAVDNSCALQKLSEPACKAADPSNGDVYVVDAGGGEASELRRVVDKFSATGEYLGQISENEEGRGFKYNVEGVAIDLSGTVWVYSESLTVNGYSNGPSNEFVEKIALTGVVGFGAPGFAVDGEGNFYGRLRGERTPQITKWDHKGHVLNESLDGEGTTAVSVDQISNEALVDKGTSVDVFGPEGTKIEALGEEGGEQHLSEGAGIGVNANSSSLYVADPKGAAGAVVVFGPAAVATPKVENVALQGESFSNVDASSASVTAKINPRSEPGEAATEYNFQYGRCATPTTCATSGYEATLPTGQIAADFEVHPVSAKLEGLLPHTTYHFRVIARNSHLEGTPGAEASFTTEGAGGELKLPDNRGWELVSPPDKQGALISPIGESGVVQAAASGDGLTYLTNAPTEPEPEGYSNEVQVLSRRGSASWSSRDIAIPHSGATGKAVGKGAGSEYQFFDPELTLSAVNPFGEFIPALSPQASESTAYLHDLGPACAGDCFQPLVTGKAGFANVPAGTVFGEEELCKPRAEGTTATAACGPQFRGASRDLSHVVLSANAPLTPGAAPLEGLYEWTAGALSPVSVLPSKEVVGEATLGLKNQAARQAISSDGTRIAWTRKEVLYDREMTSGETVQLDAAEGGCLSEGCQSGGGSFQFASADGSRVLFTDFHALTGDAGAKSGQSDLYECDVAAIAPGEEDCSRHLTDLTSKSGQESADVLGGQHGGAILGASEDGSIVYFVAKGVLSEATNARGSTAQAGKPNLYVRRDGAPEFIATLAGAGNKEEEGDGHDWSENLRAQPTRASKSGQWLEFMSEASPTGYDNADRKSGEPVAEVYLYDAASKHLTCASCEPTGVRPVGVEYYTLEQGSEGLAGEPRTWLDKGLVAANVPGWTTINASILSTRYQPRYLNDEGRLFFNTADALVPQDANGTEDVYQREPAGVGDCGEASPTYSAPAEGCVSLISSGSSAQESAFMDAANRAMTCSS